MNEACVDRNLRAGFWRRLAATWIDAFVIYALCALPITLAAIVRIRIALEPLFVVIGIAYCTILLAQGGQAVGMGAIGVRQTMKHLRAVGFEPIELERYCGSNKIWMTKVKRLRLPDVLCVRTGLRLEVRAKSDLKIRMSDAPNNPDRRWDAGLRDDDIAAFITIFEDQNGNQHAADKPVFITVGALRQSAKESKLGPPKSASEGAERDRTWPAIVPTCDGSVQSVNTEKLVVEMTVGENARRRQTYTLNGKHPYVGRGDSFKAEMSFLAGAPAELARRTCWPGSKSGLA